MKTTIILCLVFWLGAAQAQNAIPLDPATVTYLNPPILITSDENHLDFEIREGHFNQFFDNPIKFVEENFDFHALNLDDFEEAEVRFLTSKGYLKATFDKNGKLVRTVQLFKNIALPSHIRNKVYKENVGWIMVGNKYTASGIANKINKERYRIKLRDGNKIRKIKISPAVVSEGKMVNN